MEGSQLGDSSNNGDSSVSKKHGKVIMQDSDIRGSDPVPPAQQIPKVHSKPSIKRDGIAAAAESDIIEQHQRSTDRSECLDDLQAEKLLKGQVISTPSRTERREMFGIDCVDLVHFMRWEPGGEYVKQLVVKNVAMKTQKIRYKLPQTRYFSMEFPETQALSAGMSWTIPITFRPVAKECYKDVIEFTTSFGKFYFPVKATLPEHVLEFPPSLDFSLCPIRETAKRSFQLKNVGELSTTFTWDIPKPFAISPRSGALLAGGSTTVTVDFKPENASVFTAKAICTFGDKARWDTSKVAQALTINGIGKFSYLSIQDNQTSFDFGNVFVGKTGELKFVLENHSAVHANFKIKQVERDIDPYFEFSTMSGIVGSGKKYEIGIKYTPAAAGMTSTEYFDITTLSGNLIRLTCSGRGIGPSVSLNTSIVNFNDVPAGTTVTRPLYIVNNTPIHAFYQFLSEQNSIFRIDKPFGIINPNTSVALTIKFSPTEPINYYRRVYCLVEHQDGLYVDFLGTCYNEKRRPATFHPKTIENYKKRVNNGLWSFGPEHLEDLLKRGVIKFEEGVLSYADPSKHTSKFPPLDSPGDEGLVASEYFYENTGADQAVTLLDTYVDFGSCSRYKVIESQVIRITNNTNGKMSCLWHNSNDDSGDEPLFSVSPTSADIQPKSTTEFRVNFRPKTDNSFYGAQLECFVYFKSMRNFRLVTEETFTPPWCLTPIVAGNTFPPGEDTFIPKISFNAARLDFPACLVDSSVYRTVRVTNTGDTPVNFVFATPQLLPYGVGLDPSTMRGADGGVFSVKPRSGVLSKNESRLIVFRFNPNEQRPYEKALKCYFNSSVSNSYDFLVRGVGYFPQIVFDNDSTVVFRPTCLGARATRTFSARNNSRIYVKYEWKIPQHFSKLVLIEPISGVLPPNSSTNLKCTFSPNYPRSYMLKIPCYYSHDANYIENSGIDNGPRRNSLTVIGKGSETTLTAEPTLIDFGAILVNSVIEREVTIFNNTECDVFYVLEIYRVDEETREVGFDIDELENNEDPLSKESTYEVETLIANNVRESDVDIVQSNDTLPARSHHVLKVRVSMRDQTNRHLRIYYRLRPSSTNDQAKGILVSEPQNGLQRYHLCDVVVMGVHPVVRAVDARAEKGEVSKATLWKQLSLDKFNNLLEAVDPADSAGQAAFVPHDLEDELDFPTEGPSGLLRELPSMDFNFGAAVLASNPISIHLSLLNPGVVPVEWAFYFPNDLEVEIETWADPGEYSDEQIHTNLILDNNLFTITPKSGLLNPNEAAHVVMTYKHTYAGHHKLPVVFKLKNGSSRAGKEVNIYFVGLTVSPSQKCLYFHSNKHAFAPVSIGAVSAPIQSFSLVNRGCVNLDYFIDTSPLKGMKTCEHDFEVFKCLKESGTIAPGSVELVDWIFTPTQAREYEVDISVNIDDGQTQIITFCGQGTNEETIVDSPQTLPNTIPLHQTLVIPTQIAKLSLERVNFGHVPAGATLRQIVAVQNITTNVEVSFQWIFPEALWGETPMITIKPAKGKIAPGESQLCKVIFSPEREARLLERDIICEITNESEKLEYEARLEEIEFARREGRPISTEPLTSPSKLEHSETHSDHITPSTATPAASTWMSKSNSRAKQLRRGSVGATPSRQGDRASPTKSVKIKPVKSSSSHSLTSTPADLRGSKYRKLPDIAIPPKAGESDKRIGSASSRSTRGTSAVSLGSETPTARYMAETSPLYLSIIVQVHPVDESRARFEGYEQYFQKPFSQYPEVVDKSFTENQVRTRVERVMSDILEDIIQDPDVMELLDNSTGSPISYFSQVAAEPRNGIFMDNTEQEPRNESFACIASSSTARESLLVQEIIRSREFQVSVESILEGTIYNLMQEADAFEFELTKECLLVWMDT